MKKAALLFSAVSLIASVFVNSPAWSEEAKPQEPPSLDDACYAAYKSAYFQAMNKKGISTERARIPFDGKLDTIFASLVAADVTYYDFFRAIFDGLEGAKSNTACSTQNARLDWLRDRNISLMTENSGKYMLFMAVTRGEAMKDIAEKANKK